MRHRSKRRRAVRELPIWRKAMPLGSGRKERGHAAASGALDPRLPNDRPVRRPDDVPVPISVWICNERQERLASLPDVQHLVPPPPPTGWYEPLVGRHDHQRFPMLAYVDPYGNTTFNR